MPEVKLYSLDELVDLPEPEWLVANLIINQGLFMIVADPKVGKSMFTLDLSLHVARGAPFLGRETLQRQVVIVSAEDGAARIGGRFRKIFKVAKGSKEPIRVCCSAAALTELLDQFKRTRKPMLIILDPLVAFLGVLGLEDENSAPQVEHAMQQLRRHCEDTGSTIVLVHHLSKAKDGGGRSPRGSTALTGAVDGWLAMSRSANGIKCVPTLRDGASEGFVVAPPDLVGNGFQLVKAVEKEGDVAGKMAGESNDERIIAELRQAPASNANLAKRTGINIKQVRAMTQRLSDRQLIRREPRKGTTAPNPKGKWELVDAPSMPPDRFTFAWIDDRPSPKGAGPIEPILDAQPLREETRVPEAAQNEDVEDAVRTDGADTRSLGEVGPIPHPDCTAGRAPNEGVD